MSPIAVSLQAVRGRIAQAAQAAGRRADEVTLIAVSKTFPAALIEEAHAAGQRILGESQAQEGVEKVTRLSHLADLEWHFIGPIQSNTTSPIAAHFQWVHGVARAKIAERLATARPAALPPLNVCIQVNLSGESSKGGVAPGEELALAEAIARLPRLRLRGLMGIPEPTGDVGVQRRRFALLRELKDGLVARGYALDTLSMGMSGDFEAAIYEGSTMVRVGTAIFGARKR